MLCSTIDVANLVKRTLRYFGFNANNWFYSAGTHFKKVFIHSLNGCTWPYVENEINSTRVKTTSIANDHSQIYLEYFDTTTAAEARNFLLRQHICAEYVIENRPTTNHSDVILSRCICISNFGNNLTEDNIMNICSEYGSVVDIKQNQNGAHVLYRAPR